MHAGYNPYFQWTCVGPKGAGAAQLDLGAYARNNGSPATVGESQGTADLANVPVLPGNHQVRIPAPVHSDDGSTDRIDLCHSRTQEDRLFG
ncbi:hypothetical protein HNP40_000824 [Mycobacteroides chelonae]|nr:hypothetical protein [Mycobacteroides chelonae]